MSLSEAETAVMRCSQKIGYVNSISTFGMMWDTSAIYDNNGGDVFFQMAGPCQRDVFIFDRRVVRERGEWEACASVKFSWRFFQSAAFSGRATVFFFFFLKKPTGVAALERVAGVYGPSLAVLYRLSFSIVDTLTRSVAMATLSCLLFFPFVYDETIDKGPVNRRRASLTDDVHLEISVGR